ncbi:MAG: hypothetical protein V3V00_09665 [Saprospiraceae bacterium]
MIWRILWTMLILSVISTATAQTVSDAVNYSFLNYSSSARSIGAGNAFSSLGAELSTATTNPAGIAEFRRSEFVVSFDFLNRKTESTLGNNSTDADRSLGSINQIAAVFVRRNPSATWETMNVAIGMNTTNLFHQTFEFSGNTQGSIVERFVNLADGLTPSEFDNFEAGPAFDVQLLYDFEDDLLYEDDFLGYDGNVMKIQRVERTGSQREIFLSIGGNMKNKLSIGATLGIPIVRFEEIKVYQESDPTDDIAFFNSLQFEEFLETTGVGINGKIGIIYKANNNLRLAASFHSPSILFLRDVFTTDISHDLTTDRQQNLVSNSPESNFKYQLTTPMRMLGGVSYLYRAGKIRGFISTEAEYISYAQNKFNLTSNSDNLGDLDFQNDLNQEIDASLTSALNLRFGVELGYSAFRIRAGYEKLGNPYSIGSDDILPKTSVGLGWRGNRNYIDLAYQIQDVESRYSPYLLSDIGREQSVTNMVSSNNLIVTAGFKF